MRAHGTRSLLMGGQACVLYGAAEFSRDVDLAIVADAANLDALKSALHALDAEPVAVPPLDAAYLKRGHAVHFRARHPDAAGLRIDIMAVMRNVEPFADLWDRRTTIEVEGERIDVMDVSDLVRSKKTQRDKDWPMIRRLLEAHYLAHRPQPAEDHATFWLGELRTPTLLIECAAAHPDAADRLGASRPLLAAARAGDEAALTVALAEEERQERERDRAYWEPLRRELERLRLDARRLRE